VLPAKNFDCLKKMPVDTVQYFFGTCENSVWYLRVLVKRKWD